MTATITRAKPTFEEKAEELKSSLTELLGTEVTLEEAKTLLIADFIERLRQGG